MDALKYVSHNSNISASSLNLSNDIYWFYIYTFFHLVWEFPYSWYDKELLIATWIFCVIIFLCFGMQGVIDWHRNIFWCYVSLWILFKLFALTYFLWQRKAWHSVSLLTGGGKNPGPPLGEAKMGTPIYTLDGGCSCLMLSRGGHSSFPCIFQWHCRGVAFLSLGMVMVLIHHLWHHLSVEERHVYCCQWRVIQSSYVVSSDTTVSRMKTWDASCFLGHCEVGCWDTLSQPRESTSPFKLCWYSWTMRHNIDLIFVIFTMAVGCKE